MKMDDNPILMAQILSELIDIETALDSDILVRCVQCFILMCDSKEIQNQITQLVEFGPIIRRLMTSPKDLVKNGAIVLAYGLTH